MCRELLPPFEEDLTSWNSENVCHPHMKFAPLNSNTSYQFAAHTRLRLHAIRSRVSKFRESSPPGPARSHCVISSMGRDAIWRRTRTPIQFSGRAGHVRQVSADQSDAAETPRVSTPGIPVSTLATRSLSLLGWARNRRKLCQRGNSRRECNRRRGEGKEKYSSATKFGWGPATFEVDEACDSLGEWEMGNAVT